MARRRGPRRLSAEEEALWNKVVGRTAPIPRSDVAPPFQTAPAPKDPAPLPRFEIGDRARDSRPAYDLVPPISRQLASAPVAMDHKAFTRMKRGKLPVEGRIDLHGMTLDEAHPRVIAFVMASHNAGKRLVLVITGKGRRGPDFGAIPVRHGILKHQVPMWLRSGVLAPLVLQVSEAHQSHGGSGAYYVYLRRAR
ncbi:Smr/MutS family protein [Oceaniglobus roseus]|uniref:Smr/MutS family protein n=1 Tax=Oceaniglobus roseus TaxID=1737570 RepID=UPI000C7F2F49|nr:Smr/MutS family protein [Kandeliimicrobium roseum]